MSDPFSVTGSAVGVISLGLCLCGEIVQYAQSVQGQDDDIRYLETKATNVRLLLRELRYLIEEKRYDLPEIAADLESKALDLKVYLDSLSAKIKQYGPPQVATKSTHSRAKSTIKRAFYPFKKDALFEVRDCLDSMGRDLDAALTV
ncbi:hypothetical protein N7466_006346 [Penicillium verhagenii]|uniref:uncharacterized protein n=1 Tax=Penicillium verhagenii TaxID=1562060 RepID=UPI002544F7D3|nr:uncharacterized protein N7466_006346 [Penicillium verhagenii]KAJ5930853.1 hypothetical protein N7466_006346 [Penicillium verhagenii]